MGMAHTVAMEATMPCSLHADICTCDEAAGIKAGTF